jgi:lipopolysaccharide/colanic/teichoic acid biosynthesis glycosyltransferase
MKEEEVVQSHWSYDAMAGKRRVFFVRECIISLFRFGGKDLGYKIIQRMLDIVLSLIALIVISPLILFIAILIKIDSPGPVFFKQYRIGVNRRRQGRGNYHGTEYRKIDMNGKRFVFYKFRTMYTDSRERFPELYEYNYTMEEFKNMVVQNPNDPRVTRIGKLLRKISLDELPNFINVLKGDMNIVGPRPDIWENIKYYPKEHLKKFSIKPGITCIAQIKGRGNLTFLQTNIYDLEYLEKRSLLFDLSIMYKTILVVVKRDGAF